jgi:hypothetical protein
VWPSIEKRFHIQRLLGTGSFGVVYEAFDSYRNRIVALKTLTRADADSVARFKREFRSLAELRHQNLASLYELFKLNHEWTLSMELIRGTDLLEHLSFAEIQSAFLDPEPSAAFDPDARISLRRLSVKEGKLSANYVRNVRDSFRQLAEALAFLHANGVVHRDVKPSNVMITPEGRVVLLDFGLAIDARSDPSLDHHLIVGTPGYMSPEQIAMARPVPSSDWYSFGVMLYQALTGWGLFAGATTVEILERQLRATHTPAREVLPGLPEDLCTLSDRCLERDPARRPSASEILEVFGSSLLQARGDLRGRERRPAKLIGRDRELHTLAGYVTDLAATGSGMVLLHGSPGVGKSVLADRVLDEVRATTNALILGACCHGWESLPYNAIDAIVDSVARVARAEASPAVDEVMGRSVAMTQVFPTLAFHHGPASDDATVVMPASAAKVMALGAIELRSLLEALAGNRPIVLFLDDAQWGDYQSAEVFAQLLDGSSGVPIVLVLCYSTEDWRTSLLLQALISMPIPRHELRIDALSPPQSARLAKRELPDASRSARHVAAQQSDGNPALLEHIVRYVADDGSAEPLLAHAVAARLAGLSTSAQRIYSLLRDADGPLAEDEVERRLELFESDEPLRTLTRSRLVRLRRTGDLFELDLYHPRLRA